MGGVATDEGVMAPAYVSRQYPRMHAALYRAAFANLRRLPPFICRRLFLSHSCHRREFCASTARIARINNNITAGTYVDAIVQTMLPPNKHSPLHCLGIPRKLLEHDVHSSALECQMTDLHWSVRCGSSTNFLRIPILGHTEIALIVRSKCSRNITDFLPQEQNFLEDSRCLYILCHKYINTIRIMR